LEPRVEEQVHIPGTERSAVVQGGLTFSRFSYAADEPEVTLIESEVNLVRCEGGSMFWWPTQGRAKLRHREVDGALQFIPDLEGGLSVGGTE
jgi:hypothetical protein